MPKFVLKANRDINDIVTGELHEQGTDFEITEIDRVKNLVNHNYAKLKKINCGVQKSGNKIIVAHNFLAIIGGVERAELNLAKAFKDRDITFIFRTYALEPALELGKYCDVIIDDPADEYETDVLIMANFETDSAIVSRIKSRKTYQQIHADWAGLKELPEWKDYEWRPSERVNKVLAVSETAQKGLKTAFRTPVDSVIVRNVFLPEKPPKTLFFLTLSRLSKEKGAKRTLEMIKKLEEAGKSFVWFVAATASQEGIESELHKRPNVIFIKPSIQNTALIPKVDFLVQLSDNESYCYSVREALANGTPVIGTRIPELEKVIQPGINGFLVEKDLSDLDVEAIYNTDFSKMPGYTEPIDKNWEKVLGGTIDEEKPATKPKTTKKPASSAKKKGKK